MKNRRSEYFHKPFREKATFKESEDNKSKITIDEKHKEINTKDTNSITKSSNLLKLPQDRPKTPPPPLPRISKLQILGQKESKSHENLQSSNLKNAQETQGFGFESLDAPNVERGKRGSEMAQEMFKVKKIRKMAQSPEFVVTPPPEQLALRNLTSTAEIKK